MNNKIFHNRKALSEFILDIWSYIIFATTIFLFLMLFKLQSLTAVQRELRGIADISTSSSTLITYLRTPVVVDGKEINVAELIRLWQLDTNKYKSTLETTSTDILNQLEYEHIEPQTKNNVIRGFQILIYKQKNKDILENNLYDFKSKSFDFQLCINYQPTPEQILPDCINLAEQFIPITESSGLYIVLRESSKPK